MTCTYEGELWAMVLPSVSKLLEKVWSTHTVSIDNIQCLLPISKTKARKYHIFCLTSSLSIRQNSNNQFVNNELIKCSISNSHTGCSASTISAANHKCSYSDCIHVLWSICPKIWRDWNTQSWKKTKEKNYLYFVNYEWYKKNFQ